MQLNIGHFSNSMLKANYTIIMVLPDVPGTWAVLKEECTVTRYTGGTVLGIILPLALQGILISWKGKAACQSSLLLPFKKITLREV
jgi:hypothetical protein